MKNFHRAIAIWVSFVAASAQTASMYEIANIPSAANETSGLECNSPNRLYTHNDSGGEPTLYGFDTLGTLLRTITINNATNIDWEDIAQDACGYFYIGDFGNNSNSRTDLKIYKIPNPDSIVTDTISAEIIYFSYEDQTEFPPPSNRMNFDMEAMFAFGDSLYLFSKNRTSPFNGYTKLYSLPQTPGIYVANLVDSFQTGEIISANGQITAADISPNGSKLVLISYARMWIFQNFIGSNFFTGDVTSLDLSVFSQTEAVCFRSETELYLTDEVVIIWGIPFGGNLYYVDISDYVMEADNSSVPSDIQILEVYPNPFNRECIITAPLGATVTIFDSNGIEICHFRENEYVSTDGFVQFRWQPDEKMCSGAYLIKATTSNGQSATRKIFHIK